MMKKNILEKLGISFICICLVAFTALVAYVCNVKEIERHVNKEDADLVQLYKDITEVKTSPDLLELTETEYKSETVRGKKVTYDGKNIDCILYLDSINVTLPVMKNNTERDLELYRTVLANNNMILGWTNYGIMGHHARNMSVSLGGLDKLKVGDSVRIEQNNTIYKYKVTSTVANYAEDSNELFRVTSGNLVRLFTCDYSLKGNKVAYRVVTCEPLDDEYKEYKNYSEPVKEKENE